MFVYEASNFSYDKSAEQLIWQNYLILQNVNKGLWMSEKHLKLWRN